MFVLSTGAIMLNAALDTEPLSPATIAQLPTVLSDLTKACDVINDNAFFAILNHPRAISLFEQLEQRLMRKKRLLNLSL